MTTKVHESGIFSGSNSVILRRTGEAAAITECSTGNSEVRRAVLLNQLSDSM